MTLPMIKINKKKEIVQISINKKLLLDLANTLTLSNRFFEFSPGMTGLHILLLVGLQQIENKKLEKG
ncbi:MAG: hypothetical protein WAQ98_11255 [Blastocatellia bacterium]|jgi:hypothetical protein